MTALLPSSLRFVRLFERGAASIGPRAKVARPSTSLTTLLVTLALAGCASSPPAGTLLALPSLGAADAAVAAASAPVVPTPATNATAANPLAQANAPVLVVRRVGLPEYLLARRVRYRADATTVDDWPATFWAERIEVGMTRELTAALRAQLPGWTLCEAACSASASASVGGTPATAPAAAPVARALHVEFSPLDYRRDRRELFTVLRASLETADGALLQRLERRYSLQASADTAQAQAEVLGELLRRVAADVAPLLRGLTGP
jgi:uncharacterized lipoprotein YmbA